MVIVLAIIALLILLIAPNLVAQKQKAEQKTDAALVTTIQTQVELAKEDDHPVNSLAELQGQDLLSKQQVAHATKRGIKIEKGVVVQK